MPRLADIQAAITCAVLTGDSAVAPDSLVGGRNGRARLGIHLRHYESSLRAALHDKFPATAWLLGGEIVSTAAAAYVRERPPAAPCIAEYGSEFPAFLACFGRARTLRYVESFARLEWALGRASIAVDAAPVKWPDIVSVGSDRLLEACVALQPGLTYLRATHGVDVLMRFYLTEQKPETCSLPACETLIEIQGSRGSFHFARLPPGTFEFRRALWAGASVGVAAGLALETDDTFDLGQALRELVDTDLLVAMRVMNGDMQ